MHTSSATIPTEKAGRYLVQLCKHFAHKIPASWAEDKGHADFGFGTCEMKAEDGVLHLQCRSPELEGLGRVKYVVEDHVVRFGWKEELSVDWKDNEKAPEA
ncbi:DUF2218 domain-containing protein [Nisaea acidiphila]|uniref:DUF2218 domain-containing protein n=1 Tax=Nisaea acidiphila TaxID=1862145 RepID=A0A9J7ARR7_9PROT|nr:DUF2218 domain-containing protein [Nisaea acidiphila]UUX49020.1 DUF2218 domain-containing protein [Nisaea acidiphila]